MVVRKTYEHGEYLTICDRTGLRRLRRECDYEWNGNLVWREVWESRHPQDFIHGILDDQSVPDARPDLSSDTGETTVKTTAAIFAEAIDLTSVVGIADEDSIGIVLDDGTEFWTFSDGTPVGDTVSFPPGSYLPKAATALNTVYLPSVNSRIYVSAGEVTGDDL
ncbi:hypothetical protein LCGC14_1291810 [marine sediment metagenome]|uniref:Uncharacterized protein n=1 Tax=marine sediment metagenome TaxID=412755 RepID=A0A0F9KSB5_9ZZZZ